MTQPPPPLVSFAEMVRTAVGAAVYHVAEGSRRNALAAIAAREAEARAGSDALSGLGPAGLTRRRSA